MSDQMVWRRCSACKAAVGFLARYYRCSVSNCQKGRANVISCSVNCWQAHSVSVRHRDAWGEENTAPSQREWEQLSEEHAEGDDRERNGTEAAKRPNPTRRIVSSGGGTPGASNDARTTDNIQREKPLAGAPKETLVVASKLKEYIRIRSGMNTSDGVMGVLSEHLRALATRAIRHANEDGRKTVLDRDVLKAVGDARRGNA